MTVRLEHDSMGELQVPKDALYGAQTQRAVNNFPVSGRPLPEAFITALIQAKRAAAQANGSLQLLPKDISDAITQACEQLLS